MARLLGTKWIMLITLCGLTLSCKDGAKPNSTAQSDWEVPAVDVPFVESKTEETSRSENGERAPKEELIASETTPKTIDVTRNYIVDWACEPKYFGASSEKEISSQEEYCEWRTEKVTDTEKVCKFTTSFDESRAFHLNSRNETPFNTIPAARSLIEACASNATKMLKKGKGSAGSLCNGLDDECVYWRNSDPEICDKIRWTMKERFEKRLDFCVDQLTNNDSITTDKPLIQFGLLTDLPEGCEFTTDDKTEVECRIAKEDTCFSVSGQLRPGIRVITKAFEGEAKLPAARECFKPK